MTQDPNPGLSSCKDNAFKNYIRLHCLSEAEGRDGAGVGGGGGWGGNKQMQQEAETPGSFPAALTGLVPIVMNTYLHDKAPS